MEALGNPTRLAIYRLLVRAGDGGLVVGEIQRAIGIPPSTLSHHIAWLVRAGLLTQERESRELRCRVAFDHMRELLGFLTAECCEGVAIEDEVSALDRAGP